jgi:DNA (cytosine-5)-methyltransferase 1
MSTVPTMISDTDSNIAAVVDLFAGAGGLGIGARAAGGELRLSVELDPVACMTLRANLGAAPHGAVLEADITGLRGAQLRRAAGLTKDDPLFVAGGAPCQPFSKAAYWTEAGNDAAYRRARAAGTKNVMRPAAPTIPREDSRRNLVEHFSRLVIESEADAFLFENVPAIAHPRNRPMLDGLVTELSAHGHKIIVLKVNAVAYGVPQRRERVFVLGSKAKVPSQPCATHYTTADKADMEESGLQPMATAGEACAPFQGIRYFEPEEVIQGRWAEHLRTVPPGWNYKAHTAWASHPNPTFVTETRFWNFLLKLHPDRPSWTIAAAPGPWTGPFHWESRRLRVPELAALQAFPPGYQLAGTRRERVRQLGNAVPPPLARQMAAAVLATLAPASQRPARRAS